jgi:hypothetical protein
MAGDNRIEVTITADSTGLVAGTAEAVAAVTTATAQMSAVFKSATAEMGDAAGQIAAGFQKALKSMSDAAQPAMQSVARLNVDTAAAAQRSWEQALRPIASSFERSLKGMILGTTTFRQAIANLGQAVLGEFIHLGVGMATHWLAMEAARTAATLSGAATRTAADTGAAEQSIALSVATAVKDIAVKAYQAAAGASAAIAAIPVFGPALAPAAAAGALAAVVALGKSVASAAGGWERVPQDQLAQLHKDEMVLPASLAGRLRGIAELGDLARGLAPAALPRVAAPGGGGASGSGAGGEWHAHVHVHAIDTQSGAQFLMSNMRTIAKGLAREMRNFNPAMKPG